MSVSAVIGALVAVQSAIAGVKKAYEFTPESVGALPCFINYPVSGEMSATGLAICDTHDAHVIGCDYLVSRGNLASAEMQARPMIDAFKTAILANKTLNGTCANALYEPIRYEYLVEKFGGQDVLIVSFRLTCLVL